MLELSQNWTLRIFSGKASNEVLSRAEQPHTTKKWPYPMPAAPPLGNTVLDGKKKRVKKYGWGGKRVREQNETLH